MCETTSFAPSSFSIFLSHFVSSCSLDALRSRHIRIRPIRHCLSSPTTTSLVDRSALVTVTGRTGRALQFDVLQLSLVVDHPDFFPRLSISLSALHQLFSGQLSPSFTHPVSPSGIVYLSVFVSLHCVASSLRRLSRECRNFISL